MFRYRVSALCETSVKNELNPYLDQLTPSQLRKRMRESFALLKNKLPLIPYIENVVEHPEQADAIITATRDISGILKKFDFCVVKLGGLRKCQIGSQYLFFIRAINSNRQKEVDQIIKDEFDGENGPYPYTFFIATDPKFLWLPDPVDRKNAWVSQLKKIEEIITNNGIYAEIGVYSYPKRLP